MKRKGLRIVLLCLLMVCLTSCKQEATWYNTMPWSLTNAQGQIVLQCHDTQDSPASRAVLRAAEDFTAQTGVETGVLFCSQPDNYNVAGMVLDSVVVNKTAAAAILPRGISYVDTFSYAYNSFGIPVISLMPCGTDFENWDYLLVDAFPTETVVENLNSALEQYKHIAICYSTTSYETGIMTALSNSLEASSLATIISASDLNNHYHSTADKWASINVDAVCMIYEHTDDAVDAIARLREAGYQRDIILTNDGTCTLPEGVSSVSTQLIPEDSEADTVDMQAYDMAMLLFRALNEAGTSPEAVMDYLKSKPYDGLCGRHEFADNGMLSQTFTEGKENE